MKKKISINPEIFRAYDIRGIAKTDLRPEVMELLGKAYATFLFRRDIEECIVGMDMRASSQANKVAFVGALLESGIDVVDIGLTLAQIVYFAQHHFDIRACAMVTASHNPAEHNGLKLGVALSETLTGEDIQEMREIVESGEFKQYDKKGELRKEDVFQVYEEDLLRRVPSPGTSFKVVIDGSNVTPGIFMPDILRSAGCQVIEQNTNLDSSFPLGIADPTDRDVLERLGKGVRENDADLGFTYDADGDRMGVVDEDGTVLWADILVALFARDVLRKLPGSTIVFNALCSKATSDAIKSAGGKPIMWRTGHSFIRAKAKELGAPFAGELSGHFFFSDNFYGHDDGAFASLRLLDYLNWSKQSLKEAVNKLPKYISSPEIKLGYPDSLKFQFIDQEISREVKALLPNAKYSDIDGIRADSEEDMVIIRASHNGPYITIKFESRSQDGYDRLMKGVKMILDKYERVDWSQGVNIHAFN